jgi:hypothetical protein
MTNIAQRFNAVLVFAATVSVYALPMWLSHRQALWFIAMTVVTLLAIAALVTYRHARVVSSKSPASQVAFGLGASTGNLIVGALMAKSLVATTPFYAGNVLAVCVISLTLSGLAIRRAWQLHQSSWR